MRAFRAVPELLLRIKVSGKCPLTDSGLYGRLQHVGEAYERWGDGGGARGRGHGGAREGLEEVTSFLHTKRKHATC